MKLLAILVFTLFLSNVYANNLRITNLVVVTNLGTTTATFDIAWDNSWYFNAAPNNWDAVWVFLKSYDCDIINKRWEHVDVSTTSGDHSTSNPIQVEAVPDGKGVFIRRTTAGTSGNIPTTSVTLTLQNTYDVSHINFKVMGIEMVSVLQGSFHVGGGSGFQDASNSSAAHHTFRLYEITSENMIPANTISTQKSDGGYPDLTSWYSYVPEIPAAFPKGFNQFYVMKYEISQGQYASFLNTLTYAQQATRTYSTPAAAAGTNALSHGSNSTINYRNSVKIKTPAPNPFDPAEYGCDLNNNGTFDESDDGQNLACNFLIWDDILAYLDWAALRPMTELEYEKASRGFSAPQSDEFAWGNNQIAQARSNDLTNAGQNNEESNAVIPAGSGIAAYDYGSGGPLRVGFPAKSGTNRLEAGASYWGAMEMTGNVMEQTLGVGGRNNYILTSFTGQLGDGDLAVDGNSDAPSWGGASYQYSVLRGGAFYYDIFYARIASRYYGYYQVLTSMPNRTRSISSSGPRGVGGRGVRQF